MKNNKQLIKVIAVLFGAILIGMVILPNYYTENFEPLSLSNSYTQLVPLDPNQVDAVPDFHDSAGLYAVNIATKRDMGGINAEFKTEEEEHFQSSPSLSYKFL